MTPTPHRQALPAWPDILYPLLLIGAECALLPLYTHLEQWPPKLLLAISQGMIGLTIGKTLLHAASFSLPLRSGDWRRNTMGGYTLRISAAQHGSGANPGFEIFGAQGQIRALVDDRGNIVLFSERPLHATINIRQQSWLRFQDGEGKTTIQSSSDRIK